MNMFVISGLALFSSSSAIQLSPQEKAQYDRAARHVQAAADEALDTIYQTAGYRWYTAVPGESVQFGVPESDDRAFRVDCRAGQLEIIGPANTNAEEGSPTTATFQNGETRPARISYLGDGANFVIPVAPDDSVVETLLTEGRIRLTTPHTLLSVPGRGGRAVLEPLVKACLRRH